MGDPAVAAGPGDANCVPGRRAAATRRLRGERARRQVADVSNSEQDHAAARSAFFDRLAGNWSRLHYGPHGSMVPRIARFVDALEGLVPASASILDYGCGTGDIAVA